MTNQEAKELTLEVWKYFRDHPEIENKPDLPKELFKKIDNLTCLCPLCEINKDCAQYSDKGKNTECPLFPCAAVSTLSKYKDKFCKYPGSYSNWFHAKSSDEDTRKISAEKIIELIEEWKI